MCPSSQHIGRREDQVGRRSTACRPRGITQPGGTVPKRFAAKDRGPHRRPAPHRTARRRGVLEQEEQQQQRQRRHVCRGLYRQHQAGVRRQRRPTRRKQRTLAACASPRPSSTSRASTTPGRSTTRSRCPNDKGNFVPYLAKSVDHNADFTVWTIGLRRRHQVPRRHRPRPRTVVKNNLDAYRGAYPARHPVLFGLVFGPYVKYVDVGDPLHRDGDRRPAMAGLPLVPVVEQPARDHGPGSARQHGLRQGPHRHRSVQAA